MARHAGKAGPNRSSRMLQPSKQSNQRFPAAVQPKGRREYENIAPQQPQTVIKDGKDMVRALVRYSPQDLEEQCEKLKETNAATERELLKAHQEVEELKRYKASTVNAVSSVLDELARARSKPDHDNRRLRQQLECTNRELVSSQARLGESQTALIGMRYELDALTASFYAFASETQMLELALVDVHTRAQAKHDAARVAYDTLFAEQKKNMALEKKFMETKALYILATTRETSVDPQCDDTSVVPETSSNFSDISGITVLEMELERDMYRNQEHEALQALEAERELRLAAERDRDACRDNEQLAVAAIEAHKMAYIKAEKDKVAAVAQLEAAYSRISHRQAPAARYGGDLQRKDFELAVTKSERLQIEFGTVPVQATHYGAPRYNSTLPSVLLAPYE